ncbi:MAG: magnesium transporter [Deltaproteobacteria bacterium]|nr:magnesium transporter [Deltaproteobacteria bacterium]
MQANKLRLLHESLRRYLRRDATGHLVKLVDKTRDEELAAAMSSMATEEQLAIFACLSTAERQAHVITLMAAPFGQKVLSPILAHEAARILREMAPDDMADILADLEPDHAAAILGSIEESDEVEDLMRYADDTAGGIMIPEYLALQAEDTVESAQERLRAAGDVEMVYYVYVVNNHGHLVGVLSLRKLVMALPGTRVSEVMSSDVISVSPETDQEEVARLVARYSFLSIPVVDDTNKLLGLVTVDDVIDVLRDEATEDILKMAGAGEDLTDIHGVRGNVRIRFPWLLASAFGGLIGAGVMSLFAATIQAHEALAFFLPVILGMSGNVGTQSATVIVRALAVGRISLVGGNWAILRREILVGLIMGTLYGILVGLVAWAVAGSPYYGLTVGLAFVAGMIIASGVGAALPILLSRVGFDPAVATGPLVTTAVDILGIAAYFGIAAGLLKAFGL